MPHTIISRRNRKLERRIKKLKETQVLSTTTADTQVFDTQQKTTARKGNGLSIAANIRILRGSTRRTMRLKEVQESLQNAGYDVERMQELATKIYTVKAKIASIKNTPSSVNL